MPIISSDALFSSSSHLKEREESKVITTEELMNSPSTNNSISTSELMGERSEEGDKFSKMSPLNKVLDVLGRPGYAIKSTINEIQQEVRQHLLNNGVSEEELSKPLSAEKMKLIGDMKPKVKERLDAAWRGLSGQERITGNKLWENEGVKGIPLLGFATEVATDPLMLGGYSTINRAVGAGLKQVGKVGQMIPGVKEGISTLKEGVKPIVELFSTKSPIPKVNNLIDKWLSERHFLKGKEIQYAAQTRLATNSIARISNTSPKEVGKRIANIIELENYPEELAQVVPNILPQEKILARTLKSHLDSMLVEEMKRGVPISPLSSSRDVKVEKLRKNLDTIRTQYGSELVRTRAKLVKELDIYGDKKLAEYTNKLEGKKEQLSDSAYRTHLNNVKKLDGEITKVDSQMIALEKVRVDALKGGVNDTSVRMVKELDKQLSKLENQYWYLHSELADRLQDIPELAKGSTYIKKMDDISKLLSSDVEINLGEKGKSLASKIMGVEQKIGKLPTTPIGIPKGEARKLLKQLTVERAKREFGYFPRITTNEAKELLGSMRIGRSKLWTPQMMNALKRRTEDFTLNEFNEFVRGFGLNSLDGKTIESFFLSDPSYAIATRGFRSAKATSSAGFLQEMGTNFGLPIKDAPSTYIQLPDNVIRLNPTLKGMVFPPEVASEIGRASNYYLNPAYRNDAWGSFLTHYDQVQNVWKRWQLAVFPKYHLRNMVGNMWNNYLAGINPKYYIQAQAIQSYRKYKHTPMWGELARKELRGIGVGLDEAEQVIDRAERMGVVSRGWYSSDISYSIKQAIGGRPLNSNVWQKIGYGIDYAAEKGMKVGATIENNARLAHFLDRIKERKYSVEEAALSVKKYLFDYGDLTHFERTVLKRLMPFYTWTRKNIPLQLESLWKNPEKYMPLSIPVRNREPKDLLRLKYANPNLYQRLPLEVQRSIDTVTYVPMEGLLPAADLSKMARPQDILYDLLSPFVKEPIQQSLNKDIYFNQPIQRYRGENKPFLGVDIPVRMRHLLTTISPGARITREIDGLLKKEKNKLPLNAGEIAFATTLSTVYKSSLKDLRNRAVSKIMQDLKELEIGAVSAKRNKREEEFKLIKQQIKEVVKEMKEIR